MVTISQRFPLQTAEHLAFDCQPANQPSGLFIEHLHASQDADEYHHHHHVIPEKCVTMRQCQPEWDYDRPDLDAPTLWRDLVKIDYANGAAEIGYYPSVICIRNRLGWDSECTIRCSDTFSRRGCQVLLAA